MRKDRRQRFGHDSGEFIVGDFGPAVEEKMATKEDMAQIKENMAKLKEDIAKIHVSLIKWVIGTCVAIVGTGAAVIGALIKFSPLIQNVLS